MSDSDERFQIPDLLSARAIADDPYGRIVVDGAGYVLYVNQAAADLLGRPADELIGLFMLEHVVETDQGVGSEGVEELQDGGPQEAEGIPMVIGLSRPDGSVAYVEVGAHNYLGVEGLDVVLLRLRPYDSQYFLQRYLQSMLEQGEAGADGRFLVSSVDHMVQEAHSVLCHGWDGTHFARATTVHVPAVLCGLAPDHDAGVPDASEVGAAPAAVGAADPAGPPWATCLRTGTIAWTSVTDLPASIRAAAAAQGYRACWAVPVPVTAATVSHDAALVVWRKIDGPPKVGHRAGVTRAVGAAALAFERTQHQRALVQAATLDALTGLANHAQFHAALTDKQDPPGAVLYLDLDGFKDVNDAHGHRFGDRVLQVTAETLAATIRPADLLARLGGDEFAVLVHAPTRISDLTTLAERLVVAVSRPFDVDGQEVRIGLSVGIAADHERHSGEALLEEADRALYEVKRSGKGGWSVDLPDGIAVARP